MKFFVLFASIFVSVGVAEELVVGTGLDSGMFPTNCAYCNGANHRLAEKRAVQSAVQQCDGPVERRTIWTHTWEELEQFNGMTIQFVTATATFACISE